MLEKVKIFLDRHRLLPIAVIFYMAARIMYPYFSSELNLMSLLMDVAILGFLGLGQTLVILTGGIDLSVGNMASLATVISVWTMRSLPQSMNPWLNIFVSIMVALLVTGFVGLLTGISVAFLRIPSLIATLGAMWIAKGLAYYPLRGVPTGFPLSQFSFFGRSTIGYVVPYALIILLVFTAGIYFILSKSRIGRSVYAVGGNAYAAYIAGINVKITTVGVYVASAILAGIGGIILGSYTGTGYPRSAEGYEMFAIAAVVMGGAAMSGGEGNLWDTLLGVFILRILNKIVIFQGISPYAEGTFVGAILLLSLWMGSRQKRGGSLCIMQRLTGFLRGRGRVQQNELVEAYFPQAEQMEENVRGENHD